MIEFGIRHQYWRRPGQGDDGPIGAEWVGDQVTLPAHREIPFWLDIPDDDEIKPCNVAWSRS